MNYYELFNEMKRENLYSVAESRICVDIDKFCCELNTYIDQYSSQRINEELFDLLIKYNKQYNLAVTDNQRSMLDDICNCNLVIFPYQPNIFPSVSVVMPFIYMDIIRERMYRKFKKKIVPVYLIIDYDIASDKRFKSSLFPSLLKTECKRHLYYPIPREIKEEFMFMIPKPSKELFDHWLNELELELSMIKKVLRYHSPDCLKKINRNFKQVKQLLDEVYLKSESFASFNSLFLYKTAELLDCSVFFVEGHQLYQKYREILKPILKEQEEINRSYNTIVSSLESQYSITLRQRSLRASNLWVYNSDERRRNRYEQGRNQRLDLNLYPDVIADYIMDYMIYKKSGSVGYYKQLEATVVSDYVYKHVFNETPCPHFLTKCVLNPFLHNTELEEIITSELSNSQRDKYLSFVCDHHCSILYPLIVIGYGNIRELFSENI